MSEPATDGLDFDGVYQGKPLFHGAEFVPWDIGEPQPLLVDLEQAGEIRGAVLDAGCGLAENTLFLASRGYSVTGIDFAPTAIERARAKARERRLDVEFAVADATRLEGYDSRYDTVIDSALYHCLTDEQQHDYAGALHRAGKPGTTLHLFCLAHEMGPLPGPRAISEDNLRETFSRGWRITRLREAAYTTAFTLQTLDRIREVLPEPVDPDALEGVLKDEEGRFRMPVWQLTATRLP
jgi:SAM-dependent methyltransferase